MADTTSDLAGLLESLSKTTAELQALASKEDAPPTLQEKLDALAKDVADLQDSSKAENPFAKPEDDEEKKKAKASDEEEEEKSKAADKDKADEEEKAKAENPFAKPEDDEEKKKAKAGENPFADDKDDEEKKKAKTEKSASSNDDHWPSDCATKSFRTGVKKEADPLRDWGKDPWA